MLVGEIQKALEEHFLSRAGHGGFAAEVDDRRFRIEPDFESKLPDPIAEIHVLTVHKYAFVKTASLLEHLPASPEIGPGYPVYAAWFVVTPPMLVRIFSEYPPGRGYVCKYAPQCHVGKRWKRSH